MHATQVLQKCLGSALEGMHALRQRVLFKAVEATVRGRRLVLMDVARSWPGAVRVRAPLKALDRLLSNRHLQVEVEPLYAAMGAWLLRASQPVIVIDWSDLKADGSWHLLRAAVPVGGRTLTLLEMVFPAGQQGTPKAERTFLKRLHAMLHPRTFLFIFPNDHIRCVAEESFGRGMSNVAKNVVVGGGRKSAPRRRTIEKVVKGIKLIESENTVQGA